MIKYVVAVTIFRFLRECIFVPLANKQAEAKKDLLTDQLVVFTELMSIYIVHGYYIRLYRQILHYLHNPILLTFFTVDGRKGRFGTIQTFTVPLTTCHLIKAWGARRGTHSYNYGDYPGIYYGGKGAFQEQKFTLNNGNVLNIVVGQRGGQRRMKAVKVQARLQLNLENL